MIFKSIFFPNKNGAFPIERQFQRHVRSCDQTVFRFRHHQLNQTAIEVDRLSSVFWNCCLATGDYANTGSHHICETNRMPRSPAIVYKQCNMWVHHFNSVQSLHTLQRNETSHTTGLSGGLGPHHGFEPCLPFIIVSSHVSRYDIVLLDFNSYDQVKMTQHSWCICQSRSGARRVPGCWILSSNT